MSNQARSDLSSQPSRLVSPPPRRRRITASLRAEVVERYLAGMTSRQVAATLELGRTTVLDIVKTAGVTLRPRSRGH